MRRQFPIVFLSCLLALVFFLPVLARAGHTKTISGKVRSVKDNVLVIEKPGLLSASSVELRLDDATKKIGQLAPGMHVKIKYREEGGHKIALEVEARPEYASKTAKQAAKQTQP